MSSTSFEMEGGATGGQILKGADVFPAIRDYKRKVLVGERFKRMMDIGISVPNHAPPSQHNELRDGHSTVPHPY